MAATTAREAVGDVKTGDERAGGGESLDNASAVAQNMSTTTAVSRPSRLMSLPAELRNQIYELALATTAVETVDFKASSPGLTRANRQLRQETLTVWLSSTRFHVQLEFKKDSYLHCVNKLESLGAERVRQIKSIHINIHPHDLPHMDHRFPHNIIWDLPETRTRIGYERLIKVWRAFLWRMREAGIEAAQLSWPSLESAYGGNIETISPARTAQVIILYDFIIGLFLEKFQLLSSTFPCIFGEVETKASAPYKGTVRMVFSVEGPKFEKALDKVVESG